MNIFYWIAHRIGRVFTGNENPGTIYLQPFPTPQRIYADVQYVMRSLDPCDEKGSIYYLRNDVRLKTDEKTVWFNSPVLVIALGDVVLINDNSMIPQIDFLEHPSLCEIMLIIMKVPFQVMLYDIDIQKSGYESPLKNLLRKFALEKQRIEKLHGVQRFPPTGGMERHNKIVEKVANDLDEIVARMKMFCYQSMEEIEKMKPLIIEMLPTLSSAHLSRSEPAIPKTLKEKYDELQRKVVEINTYLQEVYKTSTMHL